MTHLPRNARLAAAFLLLFFMPSFTSLFAQDFSVNIGRGGAWVGLPASGGLTEVTIKLKNATEEAVSDVYIIMQNDTIPITGVDILEAPGDADDHDVVDDDGDGVEDADETDTLDSSPGKTCRAMLKDGRRIAPGEEIEVGITFQKPIPPASTMYLYFSKKIKNRHYTMTSYNGGFDVYISEWHCKMPTNNSVQTVIDSIWEKIKRILITSPVPLEMLELPPPYENSLVNFIDPYTVEVVFSPLVKPFDAVDLAARFVDITPEDMAPLTIQVLEKEPFDCELALSEVLVSPCNSIGTYDLSFTSNYALPAGIWQEYTFVNGANQAASDLEVTYAGSGGSLRTVVVDNPEGCPTPSILSNGKVTNTMKLDWGTNCVQSGSSVKVRVYSANKPVLAAGGSWTLNGQSIGGLNIQQHAMKERSGGMPYGPMTVLLDGAVIGTVPITGLGSERAVVSGLPANGSANVDISVQIENLPVCQTTVDNAFNAPLCPATGYFSIESVEQINMTNPDYMPNSDMARVELSYQNPLGNAFKYLNIVYQPPLSSENIWVAQNILMELGPDTVQLAFQFNWDPSNTLTSFELAPLSAMISESLQVSIPSPTNFTNFPVQAGLLDLGNNLVSGDLTLPGVSLGELESLPPISWTPTPIVTVVERTDMPNIDLDSSRYSAGKPGVPADYAGDVSGCAPASVTNCYSWLRKHHQAIDDSLDIGTGMNNNASDSSAMRNIMYELSRMMGRRANAGAIPDSTLMGKLEFIDKYRLPIRVKFQHINIDTTVNSPDPRYGHTASNENVSPPGGTFGSAVSLDWIKNEFLNGEDVELSIGWVYRDTSAEPDTFIFRGHAAALTKITCHDGTWRIKIRHDRIQGAAGGLAPGDISTARVDTSSASVLRGFTRLEDFDYTTNDGKVWRCYLKGAYSQSFDSTISFLSLFAGPTLVTPPICFDSNTGSITVTPFGGVPPYTIDWSNGMTGSAINNLFAGNYIYTVTDSWGNTVIDEIFLPGPPPTVIQFSVTQPACPDDPSGTINVIAFGGTPPYSFEWTNGVQGPVLIGVPAGEYTVIVIDVVGCVSFHQVPLIAMDDVPPNIIATQNPVVPLSGSFVFLDPSLFAPLASDNCGQVNISIMPPVLDCNNLGSNTVTLVATDETGNSAVTTASVIVVDETPPIAIPTNVLVTLDATGQAEVDPAVVGAASFDNCTLVSYILDQTVFDCASVGTNLANLTIVDASGNMAATTVMIEVQDVVPPVVVTQDIVVELDVTGTATILPVDLIVSAMDVCGILSIELSQSTFTCSDADKNSVIVDVIVTDVHGNVTVAPATVTILDTTPPTLSCPADITVQYCSPVVYPLPTAMDNCILQDIELIAGLGSGSLFPVGTTVETYQVSDIAGNQATCSLSITVTDAWTIIDHITEVRCFGDSAGSIAMEIIGGQPPFTFVWSNGQLDSVATNLSAGNYEVTATDDFGCTAVQTFTIVEPDLLEISWTSVQDEINGQSNGSVSLLVEGGVPPYNYNGETFNDTLVLDALSGGDYQLDIFDANGCPVSLSVTVMNLVGVEGLEILQTFNIFPNPVHQALNIDVQLSIATEQQLRLADVTGRLIKAWPSVVQTNQTIKYACTQLPSGIYIVELRLEEGTARKKVVVQQ